MNIYDAISSKIKILGAYDYFDYHSLATLIWGYAVLKD